MTPRFTVNSDWTFELIEQLLDDIMVVADEELKIPYYKPQIEIVTAEQMLDAYSATGMPLYYKHWSFGKEFVNYEKNYKNGWMNLAYEMVINSDPCIAYLMEENNMTMQTMVMAHASIGHSAVFKNNYMFKEHTDATAIINYLVFAKNYIKMCEEKYGEYEVESLIDACHSLSMYGYDKYRRRREIMVKDEERIALERFEQQLADYNPLWEKVAKKVKAKNTSAEESKFPKEPEQNLLYFIEKHAPMLPPWKREIIRIVRKIQQYFFPQMQTKVLNEGYATFCHYYIMTRLYEKGLLDEGTHLEFLSHHTNIVTQPTWDTRWFNGGMNPYALGFAIFMDIKRMCEHPTAEDYEYFPNVAGKDWVEQINYAMMNFKDETFIMQYLSPKVMRDFKFFHVRDDHDSRFYYVENIQDARGFYAVREKLAQQYDLNLIWPVIKVVDVDVTGDRTLTLKHFPHEDRPLNEDDTLATMMYVAKLWEFDVNLETITYPDEENSGPIPRLYTADGKYSLDGDDLPGVDVRDDYKSTSKADLVRNIMGGGKLIIP